MDIIEPVRRDIQHPQKAKRNSAALRLWHWANFVVISGSLITVLINSTITDQHNIGALTREQLTKTGLKVTDAQTKAVAHAISDSTWGVHIYFGYALASLLIFRLILEFFQLADQKFIRKLKFAWHHFQTTKKDRELARNKVVVKLIYLVFYLLLVIMVVTGLFLAFEDAFAAYKSVRHSVKEVHGFCMYLILAFIVVHLAGVFLAERKEGKGIVSDMINGGTQAQE